MTAPAAMDSPAATPGIVVRFLGRQAYEPLWRDMQRFTEDRDGSTPDEQIGRAHV